MSAFDRIEDHRDLVAGLEYEEHAASKRGDLCLACGFDLVTENSDFCADCTRELEVDVVPIMDPKHPRHYDVAADIYDNREKCA